MFIKHKLNEEIQYECVCVCACVGHAEICVFPHANNFRGSSVNQLRYRLVLVDSPSVLLLLWLDFYLSNFRYSFFLLYYIRENCQSFEGREKHCPCFALFVAFIRKMSLSNCSATTQTKYNPWNYAADFNIKKDLNNTARQLAVGRLDRMLHQIIEKDFETIFEIQHLS